MKVSYLLGGCFLVAGTALLTAASAAAGGNGAERHVRLRMGENDALAASNTTCTICEFAMSIVQGYVSDNSTEGEMVKLMDELCEKFMPVTIKQECEDLVANYGDVILQLLAQKIDPQTICREIKLCPSGSRAGGTGKSTRKFAIRQ